jgi:hypothetical protein
MKKESGQNIFEHLNSGLHWGFFIAVTHTAIFITEKTQLTSLESESGENGLQWCGWGGGGGGGGEKRQKRRGAGGGFWF